MNFIKNFFENRRRVIIKLDDLYSLRQKWRREDMLAILKKVDDIVDAEDVKVSWGIIGQSLELETGDVVLQYILKHKNDARYHFWNHGYYHLCGHPDHEFFDKPLDYQINSLNLTQKLVFEKTGIVLDTFGAPDNKIDSNTLTALEGVDDIKYWYYGDKHYSKYTIRRNGWNSILENGTGNTDFEFFMTKWDAPKLKKSRIIVLQVHPIRFANHNFDEFVKCIRFLKSKGYKFITPNEIKNINSLTKCFRRM
ncbi:MAG: DUF2334 domain-containing protein [Alphaproteobacteria bacterium]|nr:DUF2334 domain-containing protein [Alphaproteobacteria bacterium]